MRSLLVTDLLSVAFILLATPPSQKNMNIPVHMSCQVFWEDSFPVEGEGRFELPKHVRLNGKGRVSSVFSKKQLSPKLLMRFYRLISSQMPYHLAIRPH